MTGRASSVRTGNRHQHRSTRVGRTQEREEPRSWPIVQGLWPAEPITRTGEGSAARVPQGGGRGSAVEVCRAGLDLGDGGRNRRDPGTIYHKGRPGPEAGGVRNSIVPEGHGREAQGPDGRDQGRSGENARQREGQSAVQNGPAQRQIRQKHMGGATNGQGGTI